MFENHSEKPITPIAENIDRKTRENNTPQYIECTNNKEPLINVSLETLIRENSFVCCDKCNFKTKSNKGLKIHQVKMHSVVEKENCPIVDGFNHVISEEEDENGKTFIHCNICGFEYEILEDNQWKKAIKTHVKDIHKDALDEDVIAFHDGYFIWK